MHYIQISKVEERGILTSSYKKEIKLNTRLQKSKSVSTIKSMVLNHQGNLESQVGTILRIALFFIAIVAIIN